EVAIRAGRVLRANRDGIGLYHLAVFKKSELSIRYADDDLALVRYCRAGCVGSRSIVQLRRLGCALYRNGTKIRRSHRPIRCRQTALIWHWSLIAQGFLFPA